MSTIAESKAVQQEMRASRKKKQSDLQDTRPKDPSPTRVNRDVPGDGNTNRHDNRDTNEWRVEQRGNDFEGIPGSFNDK